MTLSRPEVLRLLEDNHLWPSRALGQNFVADANTVRRIARLAGLGPGDRVVEIGAGLGSLTLALAETGASVLAIERDRWLVPVLEAVLAAKAPGAPVTVLEADAMTLDWPALLSGGPGWVLVANLPYNVATPLVADLLDGPRPSNACWSWSNERSGNGWWRRRATPATAPFRSRWLTGRKRRWWVRCHHRSSFPSPGSAPPWSA